jgi:ATP-dependent exoDNAse (exonuclease V) alpha subunit
VLTPPELGIKMYHLSIKLVSRSTGRSATAASAYRSGEKIHDERTNTTHDYTRKQGVEHQEIITPLGSPDWAKEREKLWNAAELAEKRKDSRVAREYEIAIPKELSKEEGIELVREFGKELSDRYGVAVDIAVHKDHEKDWQGKEKGFDSYHAHLLSTTRLLGKEGLGEKAALELSDSKRQSLGLCKGSEEIETVRKMWEKTANRSLERSGHRERIDCRSLKEQGIEREPTKHLGSKATYLERRGTQTEIGDVNRRIEQAYEQGLKDRADLVLMNPKLIELDTDIKKALKEREKVSELSKKMERGADRFVEKYEAMQREAKQRERDREREFHRQRSYELEL